MRSALLALALLIACPAIAAPPIVETDDVVFRLGGYARSLSGLQLPAIEDAEAAGLPEEVGVQGTVLRLEWRLDLFRKATLDVHQRLFFQALTEPTLGGSAVGVGVTNRPDRTVELRTEIAESETLLLEHDLDRFSLRLFLGAVDLSLGRQAITWGTANLFQVSDVWATFSPFDLDTSQKRGIDAVRAITSIGPDLELDFVLADRGGLSDLSGGVRATFYLGFGDVYVAAGRFWDQLGLMAGVSATFDLYKLRAEVHEPWDPGDDEAALPRVTLGFDWLRTDTILTVEAHYNGTGVLDPDDYASHATQSEALSRGESYFLGRWYLGVLASHEPVDRLTLELSAIANVVDPSLILTPRVAWEATQNTSVALGAFATVGDRPEVAPAPTLTSEFGSYGHLVYLEMSAFF
ncbi:MAG: hypothetical protein ACQEXJ_18625 [Myxococcota bacterium]